MSEKLRMRFSKTGRAAYISHLDLMRTMQRAFARAGHPLAYSGGFNPHARLSIALPLSVGLESFCEFMDFYLADETELCKLPAELTAAMPEGIEVAEAYPALRKASEITWLRVRGTFEYDDGCAEQKLKGLGEFFAREHIAVSRRTKRGELEENIAPAIREARFSPAEGNAALEALLSAKEPQLNPSLLVAALSGHAPELSPDFARFIRLEAYTENMEIFR